MTQIIIPIVKKIDENINTSSFVKLSESKKNQHFTEPPPRYSEASLIKKWKNME